MIQTVTIFRHRQRFYSRRLPQTWEELQLPRLNEPVVAVPSNLSAKPWTKVTQGTQSCLKSCQPMLSQVLVQVLYAAAH